MWRLAVMVLHFSSFPAVISSHSFPILVNGFIVSSSAFTSLKLIILFPLFLYSQTSGILCSATEIPVFSKILSCKYTLALISYYIIICHCIPGRYRTSDNKTHLPPTGLDDPVPVSCILPGEVFYVHSLLPVRWFW